MMVSSCLIKASLTESNVYPIPESALAILLIKGEELWNLIVEVFEWVINLEDMREKGF